MKKKKLFISYCSEDSDLIDILEQKILNSEYSYIFDISRYTRDVSYRGSFKDFMDSIVQHDFVITLITDAYLKSQACMYEVSKLLQKENLGKFLYIVIDEEDEKYYSQISTFKSKAAKIYDSTHQLEYIKFWEGRVKSLEQGLSELINPLVRPEMSEDLQQLQLISNYEFGNLIKYLKDHKSISFLDIERNGLQLMFGFDVLYDLQNVPLMSKEEQLQMALNEATSPIYAPGTKVNNSFFIGNLPRYFMIKGDKLYFNGNWVEKKVSYVGVREDGPDAWGASVQIPAGAFFRRISNNYNIVYGWFRTQDKQCTYVEQVGHGIDVIEILNGNKDKTASWISYIAYDLDSGSVLNL